VERKRERLAQRCHWLSLFVTNESTFPRVRGSGPVIDVAPTTETFVADVPPNLTVHL